MILFGNYRLEKAESLKCSKSPVSEHLWTVNRLKGPKDFLNPHGSIFLILFGHSERKSAPKTLFLRIEILKLFVNILTPDE